MVARATSLILATAAVVVPVSVAHAGGWAATTLDPVPALASGTSVSIGYTVRQHGVRPVNVAGTGIEVRSARGGVWFYAGKQTGPRGHYVARIKVPAPGATWGVRQGWFGPQTLGSVPLAAKAR